MNYFSSIPLKINTLPPTPLTKGGEGGMINIFGWHELEVLTINY
jgi:hypothetical protein